MEREVDYRRQTRYRIGKKPAVSERLYLSPPHMSGREMKYVQEAFDQNWIAPLGPNVDAFEKSLARYCGVGHAAALVSGTAAIHLALVMLDIGPGDGVIASTFTFSATINPIVYQGATPLLVDSEPDTWNMDPDLLERAIREWMKPNKRRRIKAIIPVHLYGMPARMDRIMEVANHYGIPVIEDAAEALGSRYHGKPAGSFGKMGVLSFNGNKILTISGGGALLSDDPEMIRKARFLATQSRDPAPHYQHSELGYNYRMSNILAGIGRGQLEVLDRRVAQRRENFEFYYSHLKDHPGIRFLTEPGGDFFSNHWLTTMLIDPKITGRKPGELRVALEKENIESRLLWKPMHIQPVFRDYPAWLNGNAVRLFHRGICLPSGSAMTDADRGRVLDIILKFLS